MLPWCHLSPMTWMISVSVIVWIWDPEIRTYACTHIEFHNTKLQCQLEQQTIFETVGFWISIHKQTIYSMESRMSTCTQMYVYTFGDFVMKDWTKLCRSNSQGLLVFRYLQFILVIFRVLLLELHRFNTDNFKNHETLLQQISLTHTFQQQWCFFLNLKFLKVFYVYFFKNHIIWLFWLPWQLMFIKWPLFWTQHEKLPLVEESMCK